MKQPSAAPFLSDTNQILTDLTALGNPEYKAGLARFGIYPAMALGSSLPVLRHYARGYRKNHPLALARWETKVHEARLMAVLLLSGKQWVINNRQYNLSAI